MSLPLLLPGCNSNHPLLVGLLAPLGGRKSLLSPLPHPLRSTLGRFLANPDPKHKCTKHAQAEEKAQREIDLHKQAEVQKMPLTLILTPTLQYPANHKTYNTYHGHPLPLTLPLGVQQGLRGCLVATCRGLEGAR